MEVTGKELWLIEREAKAACYREMRESRIEGREFSERTDGYIQGLCRAAEIMGLNGWEVYCEAREDARKLLGDWKNESPKPEELEDEQEAERKPEQERKYAYGIRGLLEAIKDDFLGDPGKYVIAIMAGAAFGLSVVCLLKIAMACS